jgi:hypothetical protein
MHSIISVLVYLKNEEQEIRFSVGLQYNSFVGVVGVPDSC